MRSAIAKVLRLQPTETYLVLVLSALLLGNSVARQISDVVAVSGFLSSVGVNKILLVWIVDMVLTILVTLCQSLIVDRFKRISVLSWMTFSYVILLIVLRIMFAVNIPSGINYSLLYLLAEQQLLFFPLIFWVLANDLLSLAQSQRLFPLIATGNFVGQITGLGIAIASVSVLQWYALKPEDLLVLNAVIYLILFFIIKFGLRGYSVRQTLKKTEKTMQTLREGWDFVHDVPAFRYLMFSMIGINICLTIFEFHFLVVSNAAFEDLISYQRFYSIYRLGLTVIAFFIQFLATSRLMSWITLKNAFFSLPIAQFIASTAMLLYPGLVGGVFGFSLSKMTQLTLDESSRKSFQSLIPEERRGRVCLFMDSYLFALGTIIGCILTGCIVLVGINLSIPHYFYLYLGLAVGVSCFTIWSIFNMRKVYDKSLLNWRLKRRQRSSNVLKNLDL